MPSSAQIAGSKSLPLTVRPQPSLPPVPKKLGTLLRKLENTFQYDNYVKAIRKSWVGLGIDMVIFIADFLWRYRDEINEALDKGTSAVTKLSNAISSAWNALVKKRGEEKQPEKPTSRPPRAIAGSRDDKDDAEDNQVSSLDFDPYGTRPSRHRPRHRYARAKALDSFSSSDESSTAESDSSDDDGDDDTPGFDFQSDSVTYTTSDGGSLLRFARVSSSTRGRRSGRK
ncbi:hypothetical protein OQA88_12453 [Cercophora sp. LCS_1]